MTFQQEVLIYHYALEHPEIAAKIKPEFFEASGNGTFLSHLFKVAQEFCVKYHQAPTFDQMRELISSSEYAQEVSVDRLAGLYAQKDRLGEYAEEWVNHTTQSWAKWNQFCEGLYDTNAYTKLVNEDISPENVDEIIERAKGLFNRNVILEFNDDSIGSDFFDAGSHQEVTLKRHRTGIDYIDKCLNGGTWPGSLIGFAGAPKIGKSLWLQNLCAEAVKAGENCLYISLELPEEMIIQRIGSNLLNIPSLEYSKIAKDKDFIKKKLNELAQSLLVAPGKLIVKSFPTSTLTTIELEAFILKLEERLSREDAPFHFDNIYLDYINIMKNYRAPNSENTYQKIKSLAEDCRAVAVKNNWCIITATQTNRAQFDTTDMTANQISESAGFGATVDALFGIIADQVAKAQGLYWLKCLYDRVAPMDNTRKAFKMDKEYLRIKEDMTVPIESAEDIYKSELTSAYRKNYQDTKTNFGSPMVPQPEVKPTMNNDLSTFKLDIGSSQQQVFGQTAPIITGSGLF